MIEDNTPYASESGDRGDPWRDQPTGAVSPTFPWPPAGGESLINAIGRTWQGASLAPAGFFARMPAKHPPGAYVLYYLAVGMAVSGAQLFWTTLRGATSQDREAIAATVDSAFALSPLMNFLLAPAFLLTSLFLSAAVVHGMLKLMGGARHDYMYTVRLFCLAYSPQILGVLPSFASAVGFVWMVVVAIIGLRAGHATTTWRAATAVLLPLTVALGFIAMALLAARAAGMLDLPV